MFSSHPLLSQLAIASSASPRDTPLTANEALSGILGSISLTCWIVFLLPQLIENYRNQSAEAVSLAFLIVWFIGDVANLAGALWAGLVPVVVAIAVYFCISDGVMLGQVLYYGIRNKRREGRSLLESVRNTVLESDSGAERFNDSLSGPAAGGEPRSREDSTGETEPLLSRKRSRTNSLTNPGSGDVNHRNRRRSSLRRASSSQAAMQANQEPLTKILEESSSTSRARHTIKNIISILAICAIGAFGWLLAYESGAWRPTPPPAGPPKHHHDHEDGHTTNRGALFLGYLSAVAYLGARIPQIIKNYREQSCEGLSLLFFILSLLGNLTYGAGILAHSVEKTYFMTNLPWLIGSLGTMAEDVTIFVQFHLYRDKGDGEDGVDGGAGEEAVITT